MVGRRVKSHVLERVIWVLMVLFGASAIYVYAMARFGQATSSPDNAAIIEILLIVVLAILAQTLILVKIYEQHL